MPAVATSSVARPAVLGFALLGAGLSWEPLAEARVAKSVALLVVALVALGFALVWPRKQERAWSPVFYAFLGLVTWLGLGLLWGGPTGLGSVAPWVGVAGVLLVLLELPRPARVDLANWLVTALGGFTAFWLLAQVLLGKTGSELHAGHGNPNWAGLVVAPGLWLACSHLRHARTPLAVGGWAALFGLEVAALGYAESRVVWLALPLGLAWVLLRRTRRLGPGAIWVGAVLTLSVALLTIPVLEAEGGVLRALGGRVWIARHSFQLGATELPWGAGAGNFSSGYLEVQSAALRELGGAEAARHFHRPLTAHQSLLQLWAVGGPVALTLALIWLGGSLSRLNRVWPAGAGAQALIVLCLVGDAGLEVPAVLLIMAVLSAPVMDQSTGLRFGLGRLPLFVGLLAIALYLPSQVGAWRGQHRASGARHLGPDQRLELLTSAATLAPRDPRVVFELGSEQALHGDLEAAGQTLRRSLDLDPTPSAWVALGTVEQRRGRHGRGLEAFESALRSSPGSFRAHIGRASAALELGRLDKAENSLIRAREVYPGRPELARLAERLAAARLDQATGAL